MKLFKKSERQIKASSMLKTFRTIGGTTKSISFIQKIME